MSRGEKATSQENLVASPPLNGLRTEELSLNVISLSRGSIPHLAISCSLAILRGGDSSRDLPPRRSSSGSSK